MAPRIRVLAALDQARTQYYHFKAIVIAGMGLFTDSYDLFCISPVMKIFGRVYYAPSGSVDGSGSGPGVTPPAVVSATVGVALLGAVAGNVVFGALGDRVGRRRVYGACLLLMVCSSVGSGLSVCRTRRCALASLCFFRFLLGVGVGGDYPLSATIMSEFANRRTRGAFIAAVFSMQGFGILVSSAVTMAVAAAFDHYTGYPAPLDTPECADLTWRIILMAGAVPAALTYYWRMSMPETARYTALVERDVVKATNDIGRVLADLDLAAVAEEEVAAAALSPPPVTPPPPPRPLYGLFSRRFVRQHGRDLFACAAAWFLLDIPYYSSTLFQSQIYRPWFPPAAKVNAFQEAFNVAKFQAVIAVASTIPGYFAAMLLIERAGRRRLQMAGFLLMAVFLFALAGPYDGYWRDHAKTAGYIVLYSLTFFSANLGPNTTTFILPAELFPARFRSTCHGLSGAAGKLGALVGSIGFLWASQQKDGAAAGHLPGIGMMYALFVLGGICLLGLALTYAFTPETMTRSLEENESSVQAQSQVGDGGSDAGNGSDGLRFHELNVLMEAATKSPVSMASSHLSMSPILPHRMSL
ncbi:probable inorganic phosphate transporter 1-9 [Oryza glaberrima]|uniref:H(+)/Pi cotransporter n=1 Tax=Oryza glaberrima TaxID=4538 RepID=I1Q203_ORYGL|nr:probable inorganic phosphate transporter 1-9 [Oryza glaberrima]